MLSFKLSTYHLRRTHLDVLDEPIPPLQVRQHSSPHIRRLQLAEDDPRYAASPRAASPAPHGYTPGTPRSYPSYPDPMQHVPASHHPRNASDPTSSYPAGYPHGAPSTSQRAAVPMTQYPQGYTPQYSQPVARAPIPTGIHPYAPTHMSHPGIGPNHQPYPDASAGDKGSSRYECSWCGKGFTRPSSLKVRATVPGAHARPRRRAFVRC